jgi:integrase
MDKFVDYSLRFNRRKQLDKNGEAPIEIRTYQNGEATYRTIGISITPEGWNVDKKLPKDYHIKRNCETLIHELKTFESDFRIKKGRFSLSDFKYQHAPEPAPQPKNVSFTKFYADQLEAEKALKQPSWRTRKLSLEYFKEFRSEVRFDEVNYALIQHFDFFLNKKKLHTNTIAKHHKHLRKYIIQAIKSRLILPQDNPYIDFTIKKFPFESQYCTEEELKRLEELTFGPNERMLERCRDMFLFGCYTGLRFNDVYKIKANHFHYTNDGLILKYQANKTNKFGEKYLFSLFDGKPQTIAIKYMPNNDDALFKGLTNPKVNLNLKSLAKRAKINKPLRFKDSRDTFGTMLSDKGASMNVIKDEMQHSYITTTQKYLHLNAEMKKQELNKIKW